MKFAIQRCCTTPIFLKQYETSTDALLKKLGVELIDNREFNCCGYPLRNFDFKAHVLAPSTRNLSLAEREGVDIITLCNCCYGTLKHVNHMVKEDKPLRGEINARLEREGLVYENSVQVKHLLEVLYHDIGLDKIKEKRVMTLEGLKVATHYGCHLLRPRQIIQFDNPQAPTLFDDLVEITGAESVKWPLKLECCGSPMYGINDDLSMDLTEKKIRDARNSGADVLCVACSYCQIQFDRVQKIMTEVRETQEVLPSVLYTQLLGLCMGLDEKTLGLEENILDSTLIRNFVTEAAVG